MSSRWDTNAMEQDSSFSRGLKMTATEGLIRDSVGWSLMKSQYSGNFSQSVVSTAKIASAILFRGIHEGVTN